MRVATQKDILDAAEAVKTVQAIDNVVAAATTHKNGVVSSNHAFGFLPTSHSIHAINANYKRRLNEAAFRAFVQVLLSERQAVVKSWEHIVYFDPPPAAQQEAVE